MRRNPTLLCLAVPLLVACSGDSRRGMTGPPLPTTDAGAADAGAPPAGALSCPVTRCGGDFLGTWNVRDGCLFWPPMGVMSLCPISEFVYDRSEVRVEGTMTFNPDMTYAFDVRQTGTLIVDVPPECIASVMPSCAEVVPLSDSCSGSVDTGCTCAVPVDIHDADTGTYEVSFGDTLNLAPRQGSGEFCVQRDSIMLDTGMWRGLLGTR